MTTTAAGLAADLVVDDGDIAVLLDQLSEPDLEVPDDLAGRGRLGRPDEVGRLLSIDPMRIVLATLKPPRERLGVTHRRCGCWRSIWRQ